MRLKHPAKRLLDHREKSQAPTAGKDTCRGHQPLRDSFRGPILSKRRLELAALARVTRNLQQVARVPISLPSTAGGDDQRLIVLDYNQIELRIARGPERPTSGCQLCSQPVNTYIERPARAVG